MLWQPLSSLINKSLVEIIRELNKEFPMYSYTIYTINIWFMLAINNPTIKSIYHDMLKFLYFNLTFFSFYLF